MRAPVLVGLLLGLCASTASAAQGAGTLVSRDVVRAHPAAPVPEPVASALRGIEAGALAAHVGFLASPALEGRGLGRPGLEAAAEYAAASLALAGVPPLGDGYFQPVSVREVRDFGGEVSLLARRDDGARTLSFASRTDCRFSPMSPRVLAAPVVFAGYGIREGALRDDYAGRDATQVQRMARLALATAWHLADR